MDVKDEDSSTDLYFFIDRVILLDVLFILKTKGSSPNFC
jgi:hypothetical protein